MAILIDEARWWYKDRKWCHLVSDTSLEELHRFAAAHDIPEEYRETLIDGGAEVVPSRELLRRLRDAGLRLTPTQRRAFTNGAAHPADHAGT